MTRDDPAVAAFSPQRIPHLRQQTRPPDEVFAGSDGLARALSWGADWIWVLAAGAVPRADALERLLDAASSADEVAPPLLAGAVVDSKGHVLAGHVPAANQQHPDLARLVGRHVLPIRHSTFANCLVAGASLVRHGLPDEQRYGRYAAVEWSARALHEETGYFVPSSVASLEAASNRRAVVRSIPALLRTFRAGAWTRGEMLRELTTSWRALCTPGRVREVTTT